MIFKDSSFFYGLEFSIASRNALIQNLSGNELLLLKSSFKFLELAYLIAILLSLSLSISLNAIDSPISVEIDTDWMIASKIFIAVNAILKWVSFKSLKRKSSNSVFVNGERLWILSLISYSSSSIAFERTFQSFGSLSC